MRSVRGAKKMKTNCQPQQNNFPVSSKSTSTVNGGENENITQFNDASTQSLFL